MTFLGELPKPRPIELPNRRGSSGYQTFKNRYNIFTIHLSKKFSFSFPVKSKSSILKIDQTGQEYIVALLVDTKGQFLRYVFRDMIDNAPYEGGSEVDEPAKRPIVGSNRTATSL